MKIRVNILKGTLLWLLLEGLLHSAEVYSAYKEEATITMILTGLHASLFFVGAYFVGHDQLHHRLPVDE